MKKKELKYKYVVGFLDQRQGACYSSKAWVNNDKSGGIMYMTLTEAKKHLKELGFKDSGDKVAIFKLVPIFKAIR